MQDQTPVKLDPCPVACDSSEYKEICGWSFDDGYIARLLRDDIPQRQQFSQGRIWAYRDPNRLLVGFGTIDICDECGEFTSKQLHTYIPILGVNASMQGRGFGRAIVGHLIGEAAILARSISGCHDILFLDVYADNLRAICLYETCGFRRLTIGAIPDLRENGRPYIIMGKRVSKTSHAP
jgi:ribosomal protein S18 acetylase RimI-like enzyme